MPQTIRIPIPAWHLDELRFAGPEHLDPAFVAAYDAKQQTEWTPDFQLFRELGLDPAKTVEDIGAGTGAFDLTLAPFAKRIVAVDVSSTMLALIRERAPAAKATNVEYGQAGFLRYQHQGPAAFSPRIGATFLDLYANSAPNLEEQELTTQEIEVLDLIQREITNRAMANCLGVSKKTIDTHVSHILLKLGVADRQQALQTAISRGLIKSVPFEN